jgi:hypothetical protein
MLAAWLAAAAHAAQAFTPRLSDTDIEEARRSGAQQADSRTHGYDVQDHVLYDVQQPISQPPRKEEVEAVIAGTPYERLRYASYLASIQGEPMTALQAQAEARKLDGTLHLVVFAHSPSARPADKDFLQRYQDVVLRLDGGTEVRPDASSIFGPAQDFFSVQGSGRERRWLGTLTWRFPLAAIGNDSRQLEGLQGTLTFKDSSGNAYDIPVDLGRYR